MWKLKKNKSHLCWGKGDFLNIPSGSWISKCDLLQWLECKYLARNLTLRHVILKCFAQIFELQSTLGKTQVFPLARPSAKSHFKNPVKHQMLGSSSASCLSLPLKPLGLGALLKHWGVKLKWEQQNWSKTQQQNTVPASPAAGSCIFSSCEWNTAQSSAIIHEKALLLFTPFAISYSRRNLRVWYS